MKYVFIALPGTGKTTAVKTLNSTICDGSSIAIDLDIKGLKSFPGMVKYDLTHLVNDVLKTNIDFVFTHEGAIDVMGLDPRIVVCWVVPSDRALKTWYRRIAKRGDSKRFVSEVKTKCESWRLDMVEDFMLHGRDGIDMICYLEKDEYLIDFVRHLISVNLNSAQNEEDM